MGRRDRREMFKQKMDRARQRNDERAREAEVRPCTEDAVDHYIKTAYAKRTLPILFVAPAYKDDEEASQSASHIASRFGFETFQRMDGDRAVGDADCDTGMVAFCDDILAGKKGLVGLFNATDVEALIMRLESSKFNINRPSILNIRVIVILNEDGSVIQVIESVALNRETGEIVLNWPFIKGDKPGVFKAAKSVLFGINFGDDDRFKVESDPPAEGDGGDKGGQQQ